MAIDFNGLFTSPDEIRNKRLQELTNRGSDISKMGGSMNQLLGQVAARGALTGDVLSEGIGNIAGTQTREEAKAAQVQNMMGGVDPSDYAGLVDLAKQLNGMGMTKEAIALVEIAKQRRTEAQAQEDRDKKAKQGDTREVRKVIMRKMSIGSGDNAQVVEVPTQVVVTQQWDDKKQQWVDMTGLPAASGDGSYGGITVIDPKTGMTTLKEGDPKVDGFDEDLTISP